MTTRNLKRFGFLGFAIALISSCSNTAHIEKDPAANLGNYKTYSWVPNEKTGSKKDHKNDLAEANIHNAVSRQLEKNGYTEVKENADLLLTYDLLVEKNVKQGNDPIYTRPATRLYYNPYTRRYGTIYYPSQFLGYNNYDKPVKEGTITISMIDPKTDKTIWQGWATDEINSSRITAKEIERNVKTIFKKFDVASR